MLCPLVTTVKRCRSGPEHAQHTCGLKSSFSAKNIKVPCCRALAAQLLRQQGSELSVLIRLRLVVPEYADSRAPEAASWLRKS